MLEVVRVPVLSDNYAWLVHDHASGETLAVDPGEAGPVLSAAAERGWRIGQVWATHWHPDHVAGIPEIKAGGAVVTGPAAEAARIPTLDRTVAEGDAVTLGEHRAAVMEAPGHTAGHIVFHFDEAGLVFTGDTLFAMGCGRLFEGTVQQMFGAMRRLAELPDGTQVYCGHEYTQGNGRFALSVEPDNQALRARMVEVDALRARGEATVPTTIGLERATNPFMRAGSAEELAQLRTGKDHFRG
ncbi:hydroxyacylglutathione hydrolase [Sphingomonas lenta]|uniref:Hydroxyacylglutathione hydrolase n=1 Tax=Sphingomonas lenta TaxID=1141887 RepID=A0A2A2SG35_9SPHN|nr:hydroxyacylglutathione hydrolase [Sphingomonas lenta]PAX08264.1 hydroxyacylglutathione hydrolase [Sphingomonas lenta]